MATTRAVNSGTPTSSQPLSTGFPYLVTRLAPANYQSILFSDDNSAGELQDLARCQVDLNDLPSCQVLDQRLCFYCQCGVPDGPSENPPGGGIVNSGGLKPVMPIPRTSELKRRHLWFDGFAKDLNPSSAIVFGDLTKGGDARAAALPEVMSES
jgi:hypothetical protein